MSCEIEHAALTDRGRVRRRNEDNWSADPTAGIYVVSDGLGGQSAGALASQIVVETLPLLLRKRLPRAGDLAVAADLVRGVLCELSRQVYRQTQGEPGLEGMGATVVLAVVRETQALLAHLGDSRAYWFRDGRLERLTSDHSVVQLLIDDGEISPEQARTHPARGCVTRSVGMAGEPLPECRLVELQPGDRLLLCTDGLIGMVDDRSLGQILAAEGELKTACQRLIEAANEAGGKDNITVLLLEWRREKG